MLDSEKIRFELKKIYFNNNILDKNNENVYYHLVRVADNFEINSILRVIALLHDAVEDKVMTCGEIAKLLFDSSNNVDDDCLTIFRIIKEIKVLTRVKDQDYLNDYIPLVLDSQIARSVKLADLKDNAFRSIHIVTQRDIDRINKYLKAIMMIQERDVDDKIRGLKFYNDN